MKIIKGAGKRTKKFYEHIKHVNNWYRANEGHAFKVVTTSIAALGKTRKILKNHVPMSTDIEAWIKWYDGLDKKNNYHKKAEN